MRHGSPLIISGATNESSKLYKKINTFVKNMIKGGEEDEKRFFSDEKQSKLF